MCIFTGNIKGGGKIINPMPNLPPDSKPRIERRGLKTKNQEYGIILSERECNLIKRLREIPYGEVIIFLMDSQPVRIERVKESVKL